MAEKKYRENIASEFIFIFLSFQTGVIHEKSKREIKKTKATSVDLLFSRILSTRQTISAHNLHDALKRRKKKKKLKF